VEVVWEEVSRQRGKCLWISAWLTPKATKEALDLVLLAWVVAAVEVVGVARKEAI